MDHQFLSLFFHHVPGESLYGIRTSDFYIVMGIYGWMQWKKEIQRLILKSIQCPLMITSRSSALFCLSIFFGIHFRSIHRCCPAILGFFDNMGSGIDHIFGCKEIHRKLDLLVCDRFHFSVSFYLPRFISNGRFIFCLSDHYLLWLSVLEI